MPYQLSPGVNVTEIDLTTIVPAVASTDGAISGVFHWGPVNERVLVDSETSLYNRFGRPDNFNAETWFTAASFLAYANRLYVVRTANTSLPTPSATFSIVGSSNNALALVGANGTYTPATVGVNTQLFTVQSNNAGILADLSVTSTNATHVTLSNTVTFVGNVNIMFSTKNHSAYNAIATEGFIGDLSAQVVRNRTDYLKKDGIFDVDADYIAKYPGAFGNSLRVSVCDAANQFFNTLTLANSIMDGYLSAAVGSNNVTVVLTPGVASNVVASNTLATTLLASVAINDYIQVGNSSIGTQYLKVTNKSAVTTNATVSTFTFSTEDPYRLSTPYTSNTLPRYWEFYHVSDLAPGQSDYVNTFGNTAANDELHIVVVDDGGKFSGTPGTILEIFLGLSRATDCKTNEGAGNYYKDVINHDSKYIWWANDRGNAVSANAQYIASSTNTEALDLAFKFGQDGADESNISIGSLATGYDYFASAEDVDISLVLQGKPRGGVDPGTGKVGFQLANYIIDNICETRKDCIVLVTPESSLTVHNAGNEALDLVDWRNAVHGSSYAVLDSGYKYMYDRYNDVYRWIPLNGDIAGLCVRTDTTNDPWWSPAGYNRGQIKNLIYPAWNPRKAARDILYKNGINPVVTFPGIGTILYGDKTLLAKPSAFDRINVRRLFIVLEKAISIAARYTLFEFNDAFTRAQFKNMVTPYLRDVQGRRGLTDFLVVCDSSNNTGEVIDRNEFVGDIYLKPARSINYITLNFVAVRTGVEFSEVVGRF